MLVLASLLLLAVFSQSVVAPPPKHSGEEHTIDEIYKHYADHLCPSIAHVDCTKPHGHHDGPLCASNLVSYPNHCSFAVAHCQDKALTVRHDGACDVIAGGTPSGQHFYTEEELKHFHHQIDEVYKHGRYEQCPSIENFDCHVHHVAHDHSVCGSDLQTYHDDCEFAKLMCKDRTLTLRHEGPCDGDVFTQVPVTPTGVDPAFAVIKNVFCQNLNVITCGSEGVDNICGTDGIVYANQCLFSKTKCFKDDLEETDASNCAQ